MENIVILKDRIVNFIKMHGPSLPVQLTKEIEANTMFAGAILSELIAEKRVKITSAKIGGSPLYYTEGQETKLEKLYDYLPGKEKEAYNLLKKNRVLLDTKQEPSIRVALRNIKDFAKPVENNGILFWRWYLINDAEAGLLIDRIKPEPKAEPKVEKIVKKTKSISKKTDNFLEQVREFLLNRNIKILDEKVVRKNSEIEMRVKVPSNFGELEFFLNAKNKSRISDGDLSLAHHKGQRYKIPTLFLSSGNITKKAEKYMNENLRGYLIFKTIA